MTSNDAFLAWCPFPDRSIAHEISSALLDEGLIGCANLIGEVESLFCWEGNRGSEREFGVLFKTNGKTVDDFVARLAELHPYETPAILAWACDRGHPATFAWLNSLGANIR